MAEEVQSDGPHGVPGCRGQARASAVPLRQLPGLLDQLPARLIERLAQHHQPPRVAGLEPVAIGP